jgi:hypothetical protein
MFKSKYLFPIFMVGLFVLVFIDRSCWSSVTQWGGDEAANLWLGYTQSPLQLPVGINSSVDIPNPNGMLLLGELLSRLPNLWFVSLCLGMIQAGLIVWVAWSLFQREALFWMICLPALASVVLSATSVEFWNQWVLTSVNLLFWGLWIQYLRKPSVLKIPLLILPILIAPALYLAGLVNAILFLILILLSLWIAPPEANRKTLFISGLAGLTIIILAAWLTWIPYFEAAVGAGFLGIHTGLIEKGGRLAPAIETGINFPVWNTSLWSKNMGGLFFQGSSQILPGSTAKLLGLTDLCLFVQSAMALPILFAGIIYIRPSIRRLKNLFDVGHEFQGYILIAGFGSLILAYMLSPILGGPVWSAGERMDQQIQFLPFFLFTWFALPFVVHLPRLMQMIARSLTGAIAAAFILISMISGGQIIRANLNYRGRFLSEADVPLENKMQVVDFIARDWISRSGEKPIPVYYDLAWGRTEYVTDLDKPIDKWYPAPYTIGRAFDFEFLRVYGLRNSQEGKLDRSPVSDRYIVSYAFLPEPHLPGVKLTDHIIGRLRVSVVQNSSIMDYR